MPAPRLSLLREIVRATYAPAWIAVAIGLAVLVAVDIQRVESFRQNERAQVQVQAALLLSRLESVLSQDLDRMYGLVAVLEQQPDMGQAAFGKLAARTIDGAVGVRNVAVSRNLVVEMVFPLEPNRAALGLDYRENPDQLAAALRVYDDRRPVFAGPMELVQGGQGVIARFPLFEGGDRMAKVSGILSLVIDVAAMYEAASLTVGDHDLSLALRGTDASGADGPVFLGAEELFSTNPILIDVEVPSGSWQMAAVPLAGWAATPPNTWGWRIFNLGLCLLFCAPIVLVCRLLQHRNAVIADLSARELELEQKREDLHRLSLVAQHASEGIILRDKDSRILWINPAFTEMTGFTLEEAIGKTPVELLNGDETDKEEVARINAAIREGRRYRTEVVNYDKTGGLIWIDTHIVPVLDEKGEVSLVIAVERDVTEAKQRQIELAEAREAAEKADRAKSEFLANMSHEIRTPMNGIIGMSEVLLDQDMPGDSKDKVSIIHKSAESLLQIINDILDLSRLEAGRMEVTPIDFDLHRCVSDVVDLLRSQAAEKGLSLQFDIAPDVPRDARADAGRLRQILLNLLGNAVKFTADGTVRLDVCCAADTSYHLNFAVTDTGIGMTRRQTDHVFERFTQADGAITRTFGGSGLGLTISRHLVERMGGRIAVTSEPGKGSRFTFDIRAEPPAQMRIDKAVTQPAAETLLQGRKVLLAEDNQTNRMIVHMYLDDTGVSLLDAVDGVDAVALFEAEHPEIVLMDMSMPRMDGLEAARRIRALPGGAAPVIIALTANAFESDREACIAAGMDGFLSKPLRKPVLLAELERVCPMLDTRLQGMSTPEGSDAPSAQLAPTGLASH